MIVTNQYPLFNKFSGFSLIELLIVVALIGIISAVGSVAYGQYAKKANDEYAKITIEEVMAQQKINFLRTRSYTSKLINLGYPTNTLNSQKNLFKISLAKCESEPLTQCVLVTANPLTTKTTGTVFTLDTHGVKTPPDEW